MDAVLVLDDAIRKLKTNDLHIGLVDLQNGFFVGPIQAV